MKNLHIKIVYLFCVVLSVSCSKDFLDRTPQNIIADNAAYSTLSGIEALTAGLYQVMPTENFSFFVPWEPSYLSAVCDEACGSYGWVQTNDPVIGDGWTPWFHYDYVRNVNDFIEKMATANIAEDMKSRFTAEARFIRAFYYFAMVKRYGGVPLITSVQQFTGSNLDELKVPRNSEKEIYDFIAKELDEAALALPETYPAEDRHRATRYAALALKSRAMLYAASVAEYGTVQLNGLLGFPSSDATGYWQKSYDASKQILGKFALYNANPDKASNFQELFLKEAGNPEVILSQVYQSPDLTHSFDYYNAPQSFKIDYGNLTNPTCDFVEEFEYIDGSDGALKILESDGVTPILYANPADLFKNKDPRLLGSIMTPSSPWQGNIIELRRGVIDGGIKYTTDNTTDIYGTGANSIKLCGKDGPLVQNEATKTGFYIKKFMDPVNRVPEMKSTTPWYVFRYAEILLNYAEAAVELGKTDDALEAINELRTRAGIAPLISITRDLVRHERKVELAFENQRWWDIRRWRIAAHVLNNTQFHALYPWLMWEEGKSPSEMKYTFEIVPAPKNTRTFPPKLYYEMISNDEITKNSNLVQNPGY